jgi:TPR repeat protein
MEDTEKKASASASNRLWLIISAVMAVTIVAVFMVPDGKEQARDIPMPPAPVSPAPAASVDNPVSAPAPEPVSAETPTPRAGEAARKFLAESPDLDAGAIYQRAQAFRQDGRTEDAWLLYFKAAREGSAAAAMALAEQADPAYFDPRQSLFDEPDLVQAHKWYELAKRHGSEKAGERLDKLMKHLEQAAAGGDRQAQLLLAKWK